MPQTVLLRAELSPALRVSPQMRAELVSFPSQAGSSAPRVYRRNILDLLRESVITLPNRCEILLSIDE
jgi:hypothetical protein